MGKTLQGVHLQEWTKFILPVILIVTCINCVGGKTSDRLIKIDDDNWNQILKGEWMVEFFAPWCPACRSLQPIWEDFSDWSDDLGIEVGQVDITTSPGLSGRFMITALPTIYHIKDGNFRQYRGPRAKEDFVSFVQDKKWDELEPLSSWQDPSSFGMSLISQFYRLSMVLRNVLAVMVDQYGIPAWACYLIFGLLTILVGLILGLLLVCVIDFVYPPKPYQQVPSQARVGGKSSADNQPLPEDGDDESDLSDEDERKTTDSKEHKEAVETAKSDDVDTTRRRKPRRAD